MNAGKISHFSRCNAQKRSLLKQVEANYLIAVIKLQTAMPEFKDLLKCFHFSLILIQSQL